jgi:hypothetical protein
VKADGRVHRPRGRLLAALAVLACAASFAGCTGWRENLDSYLPDAIFLAFPPERVWAAARSEAARHMGRVLVDDSQARLFSWISEVEKRSQLHASLADPKLTSRRGKVMAITLLHVQPAPGGSLLTLRANYFPEAQASHGPSPSRGTFEEAFLGKLRERLAAGE